MFIIKKNNVNLSVNFGEGEVFILSDMVLTAFDLPTLTLSSSEAALSNEHMLAYKGDDHEAELKRFFRGRGWEVLEQ